MDEKLFSGQLTYTFLLLGGFSDRHTQWLAASWLHLKKIRCYGTLYEVLYRRRLIVL